MIKNRYLFFTHILCLALINDNLRSLDEASHLAHFLYIFFCQRNALDAGAERFWKNIAIFITTFSI